MNSEAFHAYLEKHITDEHYYKELMSTVLGKIEHDLEGVAKQLKGTNERADGSILQVDHVLGSKLNNAKARFDELKSNEETWGRWVKTNVGISIYHCNKVRVVGDLLTKFPRLQNLKGISFTRLYNLRKKIMELFTDEDIANKWSKKMIYQDKLCVICFENPRESSFFIPCGHGRDYCNKCMTKSLKSRETVTEYVLDDGQSESHPKRIPGKTCPVCRKRNCLIQRMY